MVKEDLLSEESLTNTAAIFEALLSTSKDLTNVDAMNETVTTLARAVSTANTPNTHHFSTPWIDGNISETNLSFENVSRKFENSTIDDSFSTEILWTVNVIYYSIVVPLSILGNTLAIVVSMKIVRNRKSIPDFMVGTLATSDLLMTIFVHSISIASLVNGEWVGGRFTCDIQYTLSWSFWKFAFFNIQLQTIDRYMAINKPFYYRGTVTMRKMVYVIVFFIVFSFSTTLLTVISHDDSLNLKQGWYLCLDYDSEMGETYYTILLVLYGFIFITGLLVFAFCNIAVALTLCRFRRRAVASDIGSDARMRTERKYAVLIMAVSVCFVIFWTPYWNFLVFDLAGVPYNIYLENVAFMLLYTNAMVNPILYGLFKPTYRRGSLYVIKVTFYYLTFCRLVKRPKDNNIFYERRSFRRKQVESVFASTTATEMKNPNELDIYGSANTVLSDVSNMANRENNKKGTEDTDSIAVSAKSDEDSTFSENVNVNLSGEDITGTVKSENIFVAVDRCEENNGQITQHSGDTDIRDGTTPSKRAMCTHSCNETIRSVDKQSTDNSKHPPCRSSSDEINAMTHSTNTHSFNEIANPASSTNTKSCYEHNTPTNSTNTNVCNAVTNQTCSANNNACNERNIPTSSTNTNSCNENNTAICPTNKNSCHKNTTAQCSSDNHSCDDTTSEDNGQKVTEDCNIINDNVNTIEKQRKDMVENLHLMDNTADECSSEETVIWV